jgi:hypothetical protein
MDANYLNQLTRSGFGMADQYLANVQVPAAAPYPHNTGVREPFWSNAYSGDYVRKNGGRDYNPQYEQLARATENFNQSVRQSDADMFQRGLANRPLDMAFGERAAQANYGRQMGMLQGLLGGLSGLMEPFSMKNMGQSSGYGGMGDGMKNTQFRDSGNKPVGGISRGSGRKSPVSGLL